MSYGIADAPFVVYTAGRTGYECVGSCHMTLEKNTR